MSKQRQKGTFAESALCGYLTGRGYPAERRALSGSLDKGDLNVPSLSDYIFEVKNHRTPQYQAWLREAEQERINAAAKFGVVVHKPHGVGTTKVGQWQIVMTLDTFLAILEGDQTVRRDQA